MSEYEKNDGKRAQRRHHKNRLKNKRQDDMSYHESQPIGKHVNTPTACSCEACGNPRNYYGNSELACTMQERKAPDVTEWIG